MDYNRVEEQRRTSVERKLDIALNYLKSPLFPYKAHHKQLRDSIEMYRVDLKSRNIPGEVIRHIYRMPLERWILELYYRLDIPS